MGLTGVTARLRDCWPLASQTDHSLQGVASQHDLDSTRTLAARHSWLPTTSRWRVWVARTGLHSLQSFHRPTLHWQGRFSKLAKLLAQNGESVTLRRRVSVPSLQSTQSLHESTMQQGWVSLMAT
jgi:hypothetical protein